MRFNSIQDLKGLTVLQVIPALDAGGAERTTVEVSKAIVDSGGRSLVFSSGGRLEEDIETTGGKIIKGPVGSKNPLVIWRNSRDLINIIRNKNVSIIHARSRAPAWSALWASKATDVGFVTTYHGAYRAVSAIKRFYNSSMTRADKVIANSQFTATRILEQTDLAPEKLVVVPRGADLDRFAPHKVTDDDRRNLLRQWKLSEDDLIILLPARLTDWKGHLVAVEAFSRVRSDLPPRTKLVFTGDDQGRTDFRAKVERAIERHDLSDDVLLVGHTDNMPAAFSLAHIVLSPATRPEAFGRVAVEAGAMERVVIAANHGGAQETIIDGKTGFLVTPGDDEMLAEQIKKTFALSVDERLNVGGEARAHVEAKYSITSMTSSTLAVYVSAMKKPS